VANTYRYLLEGKATDKRSDTESRVLRTYIHWARKLRWYQHAVALITSSYHNKRCQWSRYTTARQAGRSTALAPPCLPLCFASVTVWTENENFTYIWPLTALFVLFWQWNNLSSVGGLCVLRATTDKRSSTFLRKKVHPGDLDRGCSDLEMTWLLCCAGAATKRCTIHPLRFRYVTNQPPKSNSAFHPSRVGKWVPASAEKAKAGMVHSISEWTRGVQVKLWDPLRSCAIPERLRDTTRCYTMIICDKK